MNRNIYPYLSNLKERVHGSDSSALLDFSINTNPFGPPKKVLEFISGEENLAWLTKYPQINAASLKETLAKRLNIGVNQLVVGNGAAELFFLLPRVLKINKGIVIQPTFGEYEPALMAANIPVERLYYQITEERFSFPTADLRENLTAGDLVYICRPNNPTGQSVSREEIAEILALVIEQKANLLIDESFIEFTEEPEGLLSYFSEEVPLILVRSLTKFYAIPGLRLGYLIAPSWLTKSLELSRDPWSVNALAQQVGELMLADSEYYQRTRDWVKVEKAWFYQELSRIAGVKIFPSETNFHLLQLENQTIDQLYQYLKSCGIAIRPCSSFLGLNKQFFRMAVLSREDNEVLLRELKSFMERRNISNE